MSRRTRAAWVAAGVVGLLGVGLAWGELSGWTVLRQPIENAASRQVGVPVTMQGRFKLHLLWRPRLEVCALPLDPQLYHPGLRAQPPPGPHQP